MKTAWQRALTAVIPHAGPEGIVVTTYGCIAGTRKTVAAADYAERPPQPGPTFMLSVAEAITAAKEADPPPITEFNAVAVERAIQLILLIPPPTQVPMQLLAVRADLLALFLKGLPASPSPLRMFTSSASYFPPGHPQGGATGVYSTAPVRVEFEDWFFGATVSEPTRG